jgi:hypothetical protein
MIDRFSNSSKLMIEIRIQSTPLMVTSLALNQFINSVQLQNFSLNQQSETIACTPRSIIAIFDERGYVTHLYWQILVGGFV